MTKNKKLISIVAAFILSISIQAYCAESIEEIKKYFDLRDTISLVNLEMQKALQPNSRSPLLSNKDTEENLSRLMQFLKHRIQQYTKIQTPLKYYYIKKLNQDYKKSSELYISLITKLRAKKIPEKVLNSPVTPINKLKLEPRLYFKPIDIRNLLSPSLANSSQFKKQIFSDAEKFKTATNSVRKIATETSIVKNKTNGKGKIDKNKLASEIKTKVVAHTEVKPVKVSPKSVISKTNDSNKIEVIPPPEIKDDNKMVATATKMVATETKAIATLSPKSKDNLLAPGTGSDTRIIKKKSMRPMCVMIENHHKARPQTGLIDAEVVYEIPVEGGITRFMALFYHVPGLIGPIRSCREYFIDRALEVRALYVHCGGSPKGYAYISKSKINSIDEIHHGKPFHRDHSRKAPHNLYATGKKILNYLKGKIAMELPEKRLPLKYSKTPSKGTKQGNTLYIKYHGNYNVSYIYNPKGNFYFRYMNYKKHIDRKTKKPIKVGSIVVQTANMKTVDKKGRQDITFIGKGKAMFLYGGKVIKGTWSKKSPKAFTEFYDETGKSITFQTKYPVWIQVVSPQLKVLLSLPKKVKSKKKTSKKTKKAVKKTRRKQ